MSALVILLLKIVLFPFWLPTSDSLSVVFRLFVRPIVPWIIRFHIVLIAEFPTPEKVRPAPGLATIIVPVFA